MPVTVPGRHSLYIGLQVRNKSCQKHSTPTVDWRNSRNRGYDFIISEFVNQRETDGKHHQHYEEEYTYSILYELSSSERKNCLIIELSLPREILRNRENNHILAGNSICVWNAFRLDVDWILHSEPYAMLLPSVPYNLTAIKNLEPATKSLQAMEYISEIGRILDTYSVESTRSHLYIRVSSKRWKDWVLLRNSLPGAITRISVLLHLDGTDDSRILQRWFAEPLSVIFVEYTLMRKILESCNQETNRLSKKNRVDCNYTTTFSGATQEHSTRSHLWWFLVEAIKKGFQICIGEMCVERSGGQGICGIQKSDAHPIQEVDPRPLCDGYDFQVIKKLIQSIPGRSVIEKYIMDGFADHLQIPLQPLKDNLDNGTYEVFESDKIKYHLYRDAVFKRMDDIVNGSLDSSHRSLLVCIAGAGRGGLLDACIEAHDTFVLSRGHSFDLRIVAVEKNYNAYRTLKARWTFTSSWKKYVTDVILSDIRAGWESSDFPFDIVVSELLGSWGDNEGAPECLPQSVLCRILKTGGIAIPASCTSSVQPVMCPVNWYNSRLLDPDSSKKDTARIHCPLAVVCMTKKYLMSSPKDLFHFSSKLTDTVVSTDASTDNFVSTVRSTYHPIGVHHCVGVEIDNPCFVTQHNNLSADKEDKCINAESIGSMRMSRILSFTVNGDSEVHGLEGYFSARLYSDILMSIDPRDATPDMVSWFPVLVPFAHPVAVVDGDQISVWISRIRCGESRRVWYEWAVIHPTRSIIHNENGCDAFVTI